MRTEVLAVFAIGTTALALIGPAIQVSRESARLTQTKDNLRNVSMRYLHPGWYDDIHRPASADKTDLRLLVQFLAGVVAAAAALCAALVIRMIVRYLNDRNGWSMDENGEWKRGKA